MDGFDSNSVVVILGATNRSDVLDPTLRRPGRFDRAITVKAPDRNGRDAILKVHVSKKEPPLGKDVNLNNIASMTTEVTGPPKGMHMPRRRQCFQTSGERACL